MELFSSITPYHWVAFGLILLTAEILGAAGFLIGAAVAAFAMGAVLWIAPSLTPATQLIVYSIGAIAATLIYFQLFRDALKNTGRPLLNKRAKRLVGHKFELQQALTTGTAKVQIGDTYWKIQSATPLAKGALVEVIDTHKMALIIQPSPDLDNCSAKS